MPTRTKNTFIGKFLSGDKDYPALAALAAGLYPVVFYYSNNFWLVNTWAHFVYFVSLFIVLPIVVFVVAYRVFGFSKLRKWRKYLIPFLNVFVFLLLLKVCLYAGIEKKITLAIFVGAVVFAYFLYKHIHKIMVVQFILALIALLSLMPVIIRNMSVSEEWMQQPDNIAQATFKTKPNIYFIQPDGYPNFSEIRQGYYAHENPDFENLLLGNNFKIYPDFRSNYATTLSSNAATFTMKHHYYGKGVDLSEGINARKIIMNNNTVLNVLKNNGYKTNFISEKPYLLLNKPKIGFDYSNFSTSEVPFMSTGLRGEKDIVETLKIVHEKTQDSSQFYFIEFFNPGHIANRQLASEGKKIEREKWLESLKVANAKLAELIEVIKKKDPNSLVVIMADHGGFVGMDYTREIYTKTQNRDIIYSIFSSQLAIHWPNNSNPAFDDKLVSSVNVFRIIFSFLSEDRSYLLNLQENASFVILREGAPKGVYKYIDDTGSIVFEKP